MTGEAPEEELGRGLARFLADHWGEPVAVGALWRASAGARRQNVLFEARCGGEHRALCATVIPSPELAGLGVELESACLRLAQEAGVPVPRPIAHCSDPAYLGRPFFVAERVAGESIPRRVLRLVAAQPGLGERLAAQCGAALAALHGVPPARAPGGLPGAAAGPGAAPPAVEALRELCEKYRALPAHSAAFAFALRWLGRHLPPPPPQICVVHGDFRNGNLLVDSSGLRAALDWEVCRRGDPMEDLAWLCLRCWRFRNDELEVGGFGRRESLRAGYEGEGGVWDARRFHWWKVFGTVRWGLGLAGQAQQHLDGSFRSIVMAASGRRVAELEYDALMLLRGDYGDPPG